MLNFIAKCLLVLTSLSPVLGVVAINQFAHDKPWTSWSKWLVGAFLLMTLCWALLRYAKKNAQKHLFCIEEFDRRDQEMLIFLFAYLLPFVRSETVAFASEWLTSIFILGIIILVIVRIGAFHFNPVMRLLGYRFYAVKNREGISNLLISKTDLRKSGQEVRTVRLASDVYLDIEGTDV